MQFRNLGGPNNRRFHLKTYYKDGREVPGSRGNKCFDRGRELPGVKGLFNQLKLSEEAAEGKDWKRRLRAGMRMSVDAGYCGFNRDGDDRTKEVESFRNVERAGEEGAPEGWTLIPGGGG